MAHPAGLGRFLEEPGLGPGQAPPGWDSPGESYRSPVTPMATSPLMQPVRCGLLETVQPARPEQGNEQPCNPSSPVGPLGHVKGQP